MPYLHQIDPIAFALPRFTIAGHVFDIAVHWYGIMYLLAFAAGWWIGLKRVRAGRLGVSEDQYSDLIFFAMMGVILGGRTGYMLFYDTPHLLAEPLSFFRVWEGGMSFHGGLLGVLVALWWWSRKNAKAFWDTVDFLAPLVPPGLGFGRLGNFIGGELWGKPTGLPWGVIFPRAPGVPDVSSDALYAMYRMGELNGQARHPSQLYEFLLEGVVMFTVLILFSRKPRPRYAVSGVFALLYGCFRFAIEFVREPDAQLGYLAFGWVTMGQILSLPLIAIGIALLLLSRRAPTGA